MNRVSRNDLMARQAVELLTDPKQIDEWRENKRKKEAKKAQQNEINIKRLLKSKSNQANERRIMNAENRFAEPKSNVRQSSKWIKKSTLNRFQD